MKILQLRFKNLNSLQGEWLIDFSNPAFVADGIFAITGPTGAGKSTILDAICLALYGSTPRLGRITKSNNEIMSRKTGECLAEVVFSSQKGKFCCCWSQRRAKGKSDGNLQEPVHEISDGETGKVIEAKKSLVVGVIEDKTGMDFTRFTRSIMLAQGGFSAFLQASPAERAPILEQITGTEIYSTISSRVFERQREEKARYDNLLAENAGIVTLSPDEEAEIQKRILSRKDTEDSLALQFADLNKALQWLTEIERLKAELNSLTSDSETLARQMEMFMPTREKLRLALEASELDGDYSVLTKTRAMRDSDQAGLGKCEAGIPELERVFADQEKKMLDIEGKKNALKARQKELQPLWQKVRTLDLQIAEKNRGVEAADKELRKAQNQFDENLQKQKHNADQYRKAKAELDQISEYLTANSQDEILVSQMTAMEELAESLRKIAEECRNREKELQKARQQLEISEKEKIDREAEFTTGQQKLQQLKNEITTRGQRLQAVLGQRTLHEYQTEMTFLLKEAGYIRIVENFADARRTVLKDGSPCPLCGAIEHPYAVGNIPELSENEKRTAEIGQIIEQANAIESEIKKLQANEIKHTDSLHEIEKSLLKARHVIETSENSLREKAQLVNESGQKLAELNELLLKRLRGHGVHEIPAAGVEALFADLKNRLRIWSEKQRRKSEVDSSLQILAAELLNLENAAVALSEAVEEKKSVFASARQNLDNFRHQRSELFSERDPEIEENNFALELAAAENAEVHARENRDRARQNLGDLQARINALKAAIAAREQEIGALEDSFAIKLAAKKFVDEAGFIAVRMSPEQRKELASQAQDLDKKKTEIATRFSDCQNRLKKELELSLTPLTTDELKVLSADCALKLKDIREETGALKQKLADNRRAADLLQSRKVQIDRQAAEFQKWDRLNAIIGSKDGQKLRNFAQGLTFGIMVRHANQQLMKMTDRYLLTRDSEQLLELKVIDNYQAGEMRSTKNLSGGESFIVSLSLALGLAKMASRKVRVDSLFLDEGFGTLDNEALQVALDTLSGLHQDGKLIGVISHVSLLKDRIATQISVTRSNAGRSLLDGPGVIRK